MTIGDTSPGSAGTINTSVAHPATTRILHLHGRERHYAWGSPTAIPELLGRSPDGDPVAELWLGTHPAAPAEIDDGGRLRVASDLVDPLPFLLKMLAADKALSLQVHPDRRQAESGFAADEAAGIPVDSPRRRYRDRNHKPELLVALTPFRALAGIRAPSTSLAVARGLGHPGLLAAFAPLAGDPTGGATQVLRSLLTLPPEAGGELAAGVVTAARAVGPDADEPVARAADLVRLLAATHPGDVGIAAALLLNDVTLRPGEGLFQPARMLHAYVEGVGIEIMATSDNVLRGGLTPKHIDVDELLRVLDPRPAGAPVLPPRTVSVGAGGLVRTWDVPVDDFALTEAICAGGSLGLSGCSVLLSVDGTVEVAGTDAHGVALAPLQLRRGRAALVTGPASLTLTGTGRVFLARPGA